MSQNKVRISDLTDTELIDHRKAKMVEGQKKYGDSDLKRYANIDVLEEIADALNILDRLENRLEHEDNLTEVEQSILDGNCVEYQELRTIISMVIPKLQKFDDKLSDKVCSDENGGERIYFGDIKNT